MFLFSTMIRRLYSNIRLLFFSPYHSCQVAVQVTVTNQVNGSGICRNGRIRLYIHAAVFPIIYHTDTDFPKIVPTRPHKISYHIWIIHDKFPVPILTGAFVPNFP